MNKQVKISLTKNGSTTGVEYPWPIDFPIPRINETIFYKGKHMQVIGVTYVVLENELIIGIGVEEY